MVQECSAGRLLVHMLEESRAEILAEWRRILAAQGLPFQQHLARTEPAAVQVTFDRILGAALASLSATEACARATAREELRALYRNFGRAWAAAEGAMPDRVADPPRITQAIWHVLLRRYAPTLSPEDLLQVVRALDGLAMDMALSRVYGYMSYKEEVLAKQQAALSSLTDELTHVEMQQRRAIALELHDSLAQQLVSLFSGIQHCERLISRDTEAARTELARLRRIAQETIRDARGMIRDLHFGGTAEGGIAALSDYIADLEADTGIQHTFRIAGSVVDLGPTREALVIRIIQEALVNARKHAAPTRIDVAVEDAGDVLTVSVCDDGRGFAVEEARARARRRGRFGLIGMQERAQLLGARLDINSAAGQGTAVRLTVPRGGAP